MKWLLRREAAAIAEGKRVLFLAEKHAALSVVKRRLDRVGIEDTAGTFQQVQRTAGEGGRPAGFVAMLSLRSPASCC